MRRWVIRAIVAVALTILVWVVLGPYKEQRLFKSAVARADRIIVKPLAPFGIIRPIELAGRDAVQQLLDVIQIDKVTSDSCNCSGDTTIEFYDGERMVFSLGLAHHDRLKWRWDGDAHLTPESQEALAVWLKERGYGQQFGWTDSEWLEQQEFVRTADTETLLAEGKRWLTQAKEDSHLLASVWAYNCFTEVRKSLAATPPQRKLAAQLAAEAEQAGTRMIFGNEKR